MAAEPQREDIIDLSKIDMPVQLEDKSFDKTMLPQMVDFLKDIRDKSLDIVAPGSKINFVPSEDKTYWWIEVETEEGVKTFYPTNWAESQTVSKTPIPKRYHDEMLNHGKADLATINLNSWIHRKPEKVMVRAVGDKYRAFVSDGFFAIDNYDLTMQVAKAVKAVNDSRLPTDYPVQFWKADVSETNLYLDIIDEGRQYDIGKGDLYSAMLVIKNSEVGNGTMSIEPGFFRWRCINRQIKDPVLRKIHKGERLDEGIFSAETRQKARALWQSEVRDVLNVTIVDDQLFQNWADELKESKEVKIEDIPVVVHRVADELKFTEDEETELINAMLKDSTLEPEEKGTAYAVIQGLTSMAKELGPDRNYEVSKLAGNTRQIMEIVAV